MRLVFHPSKKLPGWQGNGMHYWCVPCVFLSQVQSTGVVWENNSSSVDSRCIVAGVNLYFMETARVFSCSFKKTKPHENKALKLKNCVSIFLRRAGKTNQKANALTKAGTNLGWEASYSASAAGALGAVGALGGSRWSRWSSGQTRDSWCRGKGLFR